MDLDLVDLQAERPGVKHLLHELVHVWAKDHLGHAVGAHLARGNNLVDSGVQELAPVVVVDGAGQDEEFRVQLACREGHEHVAAVLRESEDEATRPVDAGLHQRLLLLGVALHVQVLFVPQLGDLLVGNVHDDERAVGLPEVFGEALAHAPVAADDVVVGKLVDAFHDAVFTKAFAGEQELGAPGHDEGKEADAGDAKPEGEEAPGVRERLDFLEADGRQRDERHVEPVHPRPALQVDIPAGAHGEEDDKGQARQENLTTRRVHPRQPAEERIPRIRHEGRQDQ